MPAAASLLPHRFKAWLIPLLLTAFYFLTHLLNLTSLPVFADEAIYIRWTQLMIDDFNRYALFPLNDGKTPLQMWLMIPFQYLFSDQLYAGRIVSVLAGAAQLFAMGWLIKLLGGKPKTAYLAMLLTTILPFWFFHHRMALIDGLMTLFLSLAVAGLIKVVQSAQQPSSVSWSNLIPQTFKSALKPQTLKWIIFAGMMFGLALLSKLTAILFLPVLGLIIFLPEKKSWPQRAVLIPQIGAACLVGLLIFVTLKLNPAFGQLFSRGSDFLYPWKEVFLEGKWLTTIRNLPSYVSYFVAYLGLPVMLVCVVGLFSPTRKRTHNVLFWSALVFILPIALLGRVVYPRYLLPASLFFTLSASLMIEELVQRWVQNREVLWQKAILIVVLFLFISNAIAGSVMFMTLALTNANQTPFVSADRVQYLTEWSSGHGITEAVAFIQTEAQKQPTAVATEGYFGTLPDAINMYLHRQDVKNIYVEGIGQPVIKIPATFKERAQGYDKVYLVVNSHRMQLSLPETKLIHEYCRPDTAPCLQIWDITDLIHSL